MYHIANLRPQSRASASCCELAEPSGWFFYLGAPGHSIRKSSAAINILRMSCVSTGTLKDPPLVVSRLITPSLQTAGKSSLNLRSEPEAEVMSVASSCRSPVLSEDISYSVHAPTLKPGRWRYSSHALQDYPPLGLDPAEWYVLD